MIHMFNKRGQEGVTLTTILLLVLGAVVVVVIILGATGILGDIFGKKEALPGNLEAVTQACKIAVQASLIADYCYEFKKIGDNEYINCEDARVQDSLSQQSPPITSSVTCNSGLRNSAIQSVCADIAENKRIETKFNGGSSELKCEIAASGGTGIEGSQTAS